jgi:ADP-heptose:LPS heptosyltransferase
VADNAVGLVCSAFRGTAADEVARQSMLRARAGTARLKVPEAAMRRAAELLGLADGELAIGVHASGGRSIKQWPPARFAETARRLALEQGATIVLTGAAEDRPLVDEVKTALTGAGRTIDLAGSLDLVTLSAVLARLDVLVTGDTGPMHLADAVGTRVVAVFGLTDPARYGPLSGESRTVRVDLYCSPCNRVRQPPERCVGHTPDCLTGVTADRVYDATVGVLSAMGRLKPSPTRILPLSVASRH